MGVTLVGLSLWTSFSISVSEAGIEARFEALQAQVASVAEAGETVTEEVRKIADITETTRSQFTDLTTTLERRGAVSADVARTLRAETARAPVLDRSALSEATEQLRSAQTQAATREAP